MDNFRKPSEKEEEYFLQEELKRIKKLREEQAKAMAEEEKEKLKQLHWMHCPKCGMEMNEITYKNVLIDKCASCGGIFLDKGELEQLLAKEDAFFLEKIFKVFQ